MTAEITYSENEKGGRQRSLYVVASDQATWLHFLRDDQIIELTPRDAEFLMRGFAALIGDVPRLLGRVDGNPLSNGPADRTAAAPIDRVDAKADPEAKAVSTQGDRPGRAGARWTEEEEDRMRELLQEHGNDINAISKALDRTPSSITSRLLKIGWVSIALDRDKIFGEAAEESE
ncbi:SANT/Myb-like DNA-binding domain-containing protein [Roseobacter sp. HKCCA0434]|uniref:SANT/Myb-like DNA-binding domain-containing protein n=1 Tax=Roseobacter sp. HKCCA0434 TaxID=3079297 RepID=UPI002905A3D7|nr:SANT/Myb-like DNA-binding domain-containing protein [Roseobacter sp. HKCCA0434]